jgi:hypothetical protein
MGATDVAEGTFVPSGVFCNVPSVWATCMVPACSVTNRRPSGVKAITETNNNPSSKAGEPAKNHLCLSMVSVSASYVLSGRRTVT